jgi:hypothetical protein
LNSSSNLLQVFDLNLNFEFKFKSATWKFAKQFHFFSAQTAFWPFFPWQPSRLKETLFVFFSMPAHQLTDPSHPFGQPWPTNLVVPNLQRRRRHRAPPGLSHRARSALFPGAAPSVPIPSVPFQSLKQSHLNSTAAGRHSPSSPALSTPPLAL